MDNTSSTRKYIALTAGVLLFLALVMIAAPLAQAKAAQLSARPPDVLQAEAEWFRARGEFYAALPQTLQSGGAAALQASYSILLGALGIGMGLLILSAAISFSMKALRQELSKLATHGFVTGREFRDGTTSQFFIVNPDTAVERYLLSRGVGVAHPSHPALGASAGEPAAGGANPALHQPRGWSGVVFDAHGNDSKRDSVWPRRSKPGAADDVDPDDDIQFSRRKI